MKTENETIEKKWAPSETNRDWHRDFPEHLKKRVLDTDDRVLFGSSMTKGLVSYVYIPGAYMEDGVDYIIYSSISYDGKGLSGVNKRKEEIMSFEELKTRFPSNTFA